MLVDMNGNVDYKVTGVITTKANFELLENQFLQWTPTGKRLELWDGKKEFLNEEYDHDTECVIRRLKYWNESSIYGFLN